MANTKVKLLLDEYTTVDGDYKKVSISKTFTFSTMTAAKDFIGVAVRASNCALRFEIDLEEEDDNEA